MLVPWRAALCAAPTILVLAGSAWLAERADTRAERPADAEPTSGVTVVWPTADDTERMHRVALKQETVIDLLDGRLSFQAAAERFWDLTSASPEAVDKLRDGGVGATDEERVLYQLVAFCRVQAKRDPERYAAPLTRVEQEARSHSLGRVTH